MFCNKRVNSNIKLAKILINDANTNIIITLQYKGDYMEYITVKEAATQWGISVRRIQALCSEDKLEGAIRFGNAWAIPKTIIKPADHRIKTGKYIKEKCSTIGPILKWAGGKTQLLPEILPRIPENYNRYIEPFVGGGALFFQLQYENSVIADSNPELINLYEQIAEHCEEVLILLKKYENNEEMYYQVRAVDWTTISKAEAAARMLYLNHTCFNGLYRLNKKGQFNTPFGKYKNPTICNEEKLRTASELLKKAIIVCGDFGDVLVKYAEKDDFIFLDPPYIPISDNADFKRYTKEQFYEEDQKNLADIVHKLVSKGCKIMLTNSNHPLVRELYGDYKIEVIQTKRNINSRGDKRKGEDVIVTTY